MNDEEHQMQKYFLSIFLVLLVPHLLGACSDSNSSDSNTEADSGVPDASDTAPDEQLDADVIDAQEPDAD